MGDGHVRMPSRDGGVSARILHALDAVGIGADDEQPVLVEQRLAGGAETQKRGTVRLHGHGG